MSCGQQGSEGFVLRLRLWDDSHPMERGAPGMGRF